MAIRVDAFNFPGTSRKSDLDNYVSILAGLPSRQERLDKIKAEIMESAHEAFPQCAIIKITAFTHSADPRTGLPREYAGIATSELQSGKASRVLLRSDTSLDGLCALESLLEKIRGLPSADVKSSAGRGELQHNKQRRTEGPELMVSSKKN